jgi:hypothetical protein
MNEDGNIPPTSGSVIEHVGRIEVARIKILSRWKSAEIE